MPIIAYDIENNIVKDIKDQVEGDLIFECDDPDEFVRLAKLKKSNKSKTNIYEWDWSKLPSSSFEKVIEFYEDNNWDKLIEVHNYYKLSSVTHCCATKLMERKFGNAIEEGIIRV